MFLDILLNLFLGLLIGFVIEFIYRSYNAKKIIIPKFINYLMYGLTSTFLVFVYFIDTSLVLKLILIFIFPTLIEFIIGYSYLKIKGKYLWTYFEYSPNFMGIITPLFSIFWFIIAVAYYYSILPIIIASLN